MDTGNYRKVYKSKLLFQVVCAILRRLSKGELFLEVLLIMMLGVFLGKYCVPPERKALIEKCQALAIMLLIFSMGHSLGQRENFLGDLQTMGLQSFLYAVFTIVGSVLVVYPLSKKLLKDKEEAL